MEGSPEHPLVALARRYFVTFYALADEKEAALMDSLVLTRAALLEAIECPREGVPAQIRDGFERTSDSVERVFTELRERVRQSYAFKQLPPQDRERIERDALDISRARFG